MPTNRDLGRYISAISYVPDTSIPFELRAGTDLDYLLDSHGYC